MDKGFISVTDQVTRVIREGVMEGRWKKTVPGRNHLSAELGVNHKTVQAALKRLEGEGVLKSQGPGKERLIISRGHIEPKMLRVMILAYEKSDFSEAHMLEVVHRLHMAGHVASFAKKTLVDLGMSIDRVIRFVEKTSADAWVVVAAPQVILDWFAAQPTPSFALYGRIHQVDIAGTVAKKQDALEELVDCLFKWDHRRIVMLSREDRRKPTPAALERFFLEKLEGLGIPTGAYNLPDWGDDPDDLCHSIESLFRSTPPTALIMDDPVLFIAVVQHLAKMGITAPKQVSLACTDYSSSFDWCRPEVTHIAWNYNITVRRVVKWADRISYGKNDRRKTLTRAKLVLAGTVGPAPKGIV